MYRMLQRNLEGYFKQYADEASGYRYEMAKILQGLMDKSIYEKWKEEQPKKYAELNNIIYEISQSIGEFPRFETLARDLWGMDYEAIGNEQFRGEDLVEQIKLVNLCLSGAYLM